MNNERLNASIASLDLSLTFVCVEEDEEKVGDGTGGQHGRFLAGEKVRKANSSGVLSIIS